MDYFIGDTHFGGEDIIKYTHRPFKDSQDMDEFIIKNWNNQVESLDTVYVVGDFFDKTKEDYIKHILSCLNGKIILIKGNHDIGMEHSYRRLGIQVIDFPILYNNFFLISHEPLYVSKDGLYANIFAHVHDNPMYKDYSCRSFCVSAERINYTPISFMEIEKLMKNCD